jgi:hypothetical protein
MTPVQPTAEEVGARGKLIYEQIRDAVEPGNDGRYVSIDIVSGNYRVADDDVSCVIALRNEHPDAVVYTKRIGYTAIVSFGGRIPRERPEEI